MAIFNRIRAAFKALTSGPISLEDEKLLEWLGVDRNMSRKAINEATYYTCLKMLSETMGKMPIHFYQQADKGRIRAQPNDAARLLMIRPNRVMTPATFWTTMEYNCEQHGNAYAYIQTRYEKRGKYGGDLRVVGFWPMRSDCVQVLYDDAGVFGDAGKMYYQYSDPQSGKTQIYREDEVIHIKTWDTIDGLIGKPVRQTLAEMVGAASEAQSYLNSLYKSGLSASAVLQYTGELDEKRRMKLQEHYNSLLTGAKNASKVVAMPIGFQLQPIKMSLAEAQFYDIRKYTALQIAAAFGIKPNQLNDYDKSSYSNSESQQLSFLIDTMLYRLTQYEQELNYKCLSKKEIKENYFFKFNEKVLLRTDFKTQMDSLRVGVNNGIYTPNEARELLDRPAMDGGDILMCNGNYIPVTSVQNKEGGDNGGGN